MDRGLEDRVMESSQNEHQKEKIIINTKSRLRESSNIIKHNNIYIIGIPEGEQRKRGQKIYLKT